MRSYRAKPKRVLAIHPKPRGFGFAILESQTALVDWGVKATRQEKEAKTLEKVAELIRHYQPGTLITEDGRQSRRCSRVQRLLERVRALAARAGVKPCSISPTRVRKVFLAFKANTKHEVAHVIARQLPELAPHLPRHRKPWMSEDYRMAIFDATALALTYFYSRPVRNSKGPEGPSA